jgi:predicted metal-dependent HD superfamily phosphohydrolase
MPPFAAQDPDGSDRFRELWQRCLGESARDDSQAIHQRLLGGYNEPGRYYHTFEHIRHCLAMFDTCRSEIDEPDAVELAIWFHDVIFEPGNPDNEALSAGLYAELSDGAHTQETRQRVNRLIMATLHDGDALHDDDARYMVDIDLSSFGLPWEAFLRDSENLRREAGDLSDEEFYNKAIGFHDYLQSRDRFFQTDFFATRFEDQARANIARYIDHVSP